MSLSNAMFASVSGLSTASTAISVIGDNIANVSTPGFKERRAEFADLLGQSIATSGGVSQVGSGSTLLNVGQVFSQGTFETTARETDLGIEGRGFFVLDSQQGTAYSRAGQFSFDNNGLLVDPIGRRVQGYGIDPITLTPNGQIGDIQLSTSVVAPQPSSVMNVSVNLNPEAPLNGPFNPSLPSDTSEFQTVLTLFDSLGTAHPSTIYFTRTGAGTWDWNATLPPGDTTVPPASPGDDHVVQGSGTLTFDSDGILTAVTGSPITYEFFGGATASQVVDLDFGPVGANQTGDLTTQFNGEASAVNSQSQDGFSAGTLQTLSIDRDGFFTASFSNGETRPLAQVVLASFANIEGVASVGNNAFVETRDSGQPLIGAPGTGRFGDIRSSSIEQSNVDLADQFIRLILNQRAFQANTRTVSTTNELLEANVSKVAPPRSRITSSSPTITRRVLRTTPSASPR